MMKILVTKGIIKFFQKKLENQWKDLKVQIDQSLREEEDFPWTSKRKQREFKIHHAKHMVLINKRKQVSNKIRWCNKISREYKGYVSPAYMGQD